MQSAEDQPGQQKTERRTCGAHVDHGAYTAELVPYDDPDRARYFAPRWTGCPKCKAAADQRRAEEQAERRRQHVAALLAHSGIRGRYLEATFDTYRAETPQQRKALQACRGFADDVVAGAASTLFLLGTPGTGKTHLSCAVVRDVIERTAQPAYTVTVSGFVRAIRSTWRSNGGSEGTGGSSSEEQILQRYAHAALLVLDDVGASHQTEAERKHLLDLVDERYTHQLPTVVASNLAQEELQASLGERTFDRLREGARRALFTWPSHRGTV